MVLNWVKSKNKEKNTALKINYSIDSNLQNNKKKYKFAH